MDKIRFLMEKVSGIQYRINFNDRLPKSFGTDQSLYQSEIHMIEAIGKGEGIGASDLAEKLSITNGAVVQTAAKLIRKKLIIKYRKEGNRKEVYYRLTDMGKIGYDNHERMHQKLYEKITAYLSELSDQEFNAILGLIEIVDQYIPDFSQEDGE